MMVLDRTRLKSVLVPVLAVCLIISGAAALSYEVLVSRMLGAVFGVSNLGVVLTVALFMAGLGVGGLLANRFRFLSSRNLVVFGLLEGFVGIWFLVSPTVFSFVSDIVDNSTGGIFYGLELTIILFFLFLPSLLLGAAFPYVMRFLTSAGVHSGRVYAANTFGAIAGCLLPVVLLPVLGWALSLQLIAVAAILSSLVFIVLGSKVEAGNGNQSHVFTLILSRPVWAYFSVGVVSLACEIIWIRVLGSVFLRTEYVMAITLAIFLAGVAAGSFVNSRLRLERFVFSLPMMFAIFVALSFIFLPVASSYKSNLVFETFFQEMLLSSGLIFLLVFPSTFILGMLFPALVRKMKNEQADAASSLYIMNSIGAAFGVLIVGLILIPVLGVLNSILLLLALICAIAYSVSVSDLKLAVTAIIVIALAAVFIKPFHAENLFPAAYSGHRTIAEYEDSISLTQVVETPTGDRLLLSDLQRMDASSEFDALRSQRNQLRLPLLLTNRPSKILLLGLGTGITASALAEFPDISADVVEISAGAIRFADSHFSSHTKGVLTNSRVIESDVRRYLKTITDRYSLVVGDLFHPDLVGRSNLLSSQHFSRVKRHLTADGLFIQWLSLNQFDPDSLNVILNTFKRVYPNNALFLDGYRLAMVGFNADVRVSFADIVRRMSRNATQAGLAGESLSAWQARYWNTLDFVTDSKIQDEWYPYIEFSLPRAHASPELMLDQLVEFLLRNRLNLKAYDFEESISPEVARSIAQAYAANRLFYEAYLNRNKPIVGQFARLAHLANPADFWAGRQLADLMLVSLQRPGQGPVMTLEALQSILAVRPDHIATLEAYRGLFQREGDQVDTEVIQRYLELLRER